MPLVNIMYHVVQMVRGLWRDAYGILKRKQNITTMSCRNASLTRRRLPASALFACH